MASSSDLLSHIALPWVQCSHGWAAVPLLVIQDEFLWIPSWPPKRRKIFMSCSVYTFFIPQSCCKWTLISIVSVRDKLRQWCMLFLWTALNRMPFHSFSPATHFLPLLHDTLCFPLTFWQWIIYSRLPLQEDTWAAMRRNSNSTCLMLFSRFSIPCSLLEAVFLPEKWP